jgi:hypothetical protein
MKNRRIIRLKKVLGLERGGNVAPWPAPRLIPCPDDMSHYKDCPMKSPKPILGCDPRLLSKLLS